MNLVGAVLLAFIFHFPDSASQVVTDHCDDFPCMLGLKGIYKL